MRPWSRSPSTLLPVVLALCISVSIAIPYEDNWPSKGPGNTKSTTPIFQSVFSSLLRSLERQRAAIRETNQSSLLKRIGIAGLDNMDTITTTLDRARYRTRPRMSMRITVADLRRLLEAGR